MGIRKKRRECWEPKTKNEVSKKSFKDHQVFSQRTLFLRKCSSKEYS